MVVTVQTTRNGFKKRRYRDLIDFKFCDTFWDLHVSAIIKRIYCSFYVFKFIVDFAILVAFLQYFLRMS